MISGSASDATFAPDALGEAPVGGAAKRIFDLVLAALILVAILPVLVAIAIAVRLETRGPAIFRQERVGFAGKRFKIWKFRTMTCVEDGSEVLQARRADSRITRLGAFLRQTSLDETPQLVNVLCGDMSLIGPRPHAVTHDNYFAVVAPSYAQRRRARPGITGLAQVLGYRGPTETVEAVQKRSEQDVRYVETWSFVRDIGLFWKTLVVVWTDKRAF
jgi:putative colanic acid biosynthesis UDP-glucose lipid carrier transferase